jgi:uncharacterized protein YdcH (DUF465 family)
MFVEQFNIKEFYNNAKEGTDYFLDREGLRHDIKERDPKFKKILRSAEEEAHKVLDAKFNFRSDMKAFIRALKKETKCILKDKYGVDWKTTEEMNPYYVRFG